MTVQSGGHLLAPPVGAMLTISNALQSLPGSRVSVFIDDTGGVGGLTTGSTALGGGTLVAGLAPGLYRDGMHFDVITASGGAVGQFTAVDAPASVIVMLDAQTLPNSVRLSIRRNSYTGVTGASASQRAVGAVLDGAIATASGELLDAIAALDFLAPDALLAGLSLLGGEPYDAWPETTFANQRMLRRTLEEQLRRARGPGVAWRARSRERAAVDAGPPVMDAFLEGIEGLHLWTQVLTSSARRDAVGSSAGLDSEVTGTVAGFELPISESAFVGVHVARFESGLDFDAGVADGDATSTTFGVHTTWAPMSGMAAGAHFDGSLSWASHEFETRRRPSFGSFVAATESAHDGEAWAVHGSAGYPVYLERFGLGPWLDWEIEPSVGFSYGRLEQDSFVERGAGSVGLAVDGRTSQSLESFVGIRVGAQWNDFERDITWQPELRIEWSREWLDARALQASFQDVPATSFRLSEAVRDEDHFALAARVQAQFSARLSASLAVDLERGGDFRSSEAIRFAVSLDL